MKRHGRPVASSRRPATGNTPSELRPLVPLAVKALSGSPFASPAKWPHAVVILRADERSVSHRSAFAAWLSANDLGALANEARRRVVRPGEALVYVDVDTSEFAIARFYVLDVFAAASAEIARSETTNHEKENQP